MRKKLIAGNWKMYKKLGEGKALAQEIASLAAGVPGVDLVVCPPYIALAAVSESLKNSSVKSRLQRVL